MPKISVFTPTIRGLQALQPIEQTLRPQTFQDFEWLIEYGDGRTCDLGAAYNSMLRRARGELMVSVQDWMWLPPDGLEKFWLAWLETRAFLTAPVPKAPGFWIGIDGRVHHKEPLELEWRSNWKEAVDWSRWEIDFGAASVNALKQIGGFDEYMDGAWGNDNTNVAYRAHREGYQFFNVIDNPAVALNHDALWAHPFRHLHNPLRANERLAEFDQGLKIHL